MDSSFVVSGLGATRIVDGRLHVLLVPSVGTGPVTNADQNGASLGLVLTRDTALRLHEQLGKALLAMAAVPAINAPLQRQESMHEPASPTDRWKLEWVLGRAPTEPGFGSSWGGDRRLGRQPPSWTPCMMPSSLRLSFRYGAERQSIHLFVESSDPDRALSKLVVVPAPSVAVLLALLRGKLRGVRLTGPQYVVSEEVLLREQREANKLVDLTARRIDAATSCTPEWTTRCRVVDRDEGFAVVFSGRDGPVLILPLSRQEGHAFFRILYDMGASAGWKVQALDSMPPVERHLRLVATNMPSVDPISE